MGEQIKEPSSSDSAAHNRISKAQKFGYILIIVGSCINVLYWLPYHDRIVSIFRSIGINITYDKELYVVISLIFRVGLLVIIFGMAIVIINANNQPESWRLILAIGMIPNIFISLYILTSLIYACIKMGRLLALSLASEIIKTVIFLKWESRSITYAYLSLFIMATFIVVKEKRRFQIFYAIAAGILWFSWAFWDLGIQAALLPYLIFIACSIYAIRTPNIPIVTYPDWTS